MQSKYPALLTAYEAYITMPPGEAARLRPRLAGALECPVEVIKVSTLDPEVWVGLALPRAQHERARIYIQAWKQGGQDALDDHYDRTSYREEIARLNAVEQAK